MLRCAGANENASLTRTAISDHRIEGFGMNGKEFQERIYRKNPDNIQTQTANKKPLTGFANLFLCTDLTLCLLSIVHALYARS
jgi:hypothetical protein